MVLAGLFALSRPAQAKTCDRDCLRGFMTQYLNAMVARNPRALPLAADVKFTENSQVMKLGDGLWQTVTSLGDYRQDILDVRESTAVSQTVVEESGKPVLLALRLKIAKGKISEIETMFARSKEDGILFNPDGLKDANKPMEFVPPASQLNSRKELVDIALHYPAGLKVGSFVQADTPFAPDAFRLENGFHTAGPGCTRAGCENIKGQKIMLHPAVTTRVAAVDEQLGIVLLRMNFGDTHSYGPGNALIAWEAFKIYGGQIHAVSALMRRMPATSPSGWDSEYPAH